MRPVEEIAEIFGVPDKGQLGCFRQYYKLCQIIEAEFSGAGTAGMLEIGSGFSTGLFDLLSSKMANAGDELRIVTLDFNFDLFDGFDIQKSGILFQ